MANLHAPHVSAKDEKEGEDKATANKPVAALVRAYLEATRRASVKAFQQSSATEDAGILGGTVRNVADGLEERLHKQTVQPSDRREAFRASGVGVQCESLHREAASKEDAAAGSDGPLKADHGDLPQVQRVTERQEEKEPTATATAAAAGRSAVAAAVELPRFNVTLKDPRLRQMAREVAHQLHLDTDTAERLSFIYLTQGSQGDFAVMLRALSLLRSGVGLECSGLGWSNGKKLYTVTLSETEPLTLSFKPQRRFATLRIIAVARIKEVQREGARLTLQVDSEKPDLAFPQESDAAKVGQLLNLILGKGDPGFVFRLKSAGDVFIHKSVN